MLLLLLPLGRGRVAPGIGKGRRGAEEEEEGRGRGGECLVTLLISRGSGTRRERLANGNEVNLH